MLLPVDILDETFGCHHICFRVSPLFASFIQSEAAKGVKGMKCCGQCGSRVSGCDSCCLGELKLKAGFLTQLYAIFLNTIYIWL